ncbi:MAG: 2Fe-2S iron-sulfur cluster-binding protein [Clostridia bacterium]|nr:2Fe-2S iron-sulfur cluster-binding protein [Clostridia bacterium]
MIVKIKRQENSDSKAYWQSFKYNGNMDTTVAAVLDFLNYNDDLFDTEGNPARRIRWECSCMQKTCGACAMIINGMPALACNTFLRNISSKELVLEPLRKFPVVSDLIVDRSIIYENLKKAELYIGEYAGADKKEYEQQYQTAKCLKCGLCLEVCPNYNKGETFFGAMFANDSYISYTQSESRKKEIASEYKKHFASGCSKSLACVDICPVQIPTLASIGRMNKKIF